MRVCQGRGRRVAGTCPSQWWPLRWNGVLGPLPHGSSGIAKHCNTVGFWWDKHSGCLHSPDNGRCLWPTVFSSWTASCTILWPIKTQSQNSTCYQGLARIHLSYSLLQSLLCFQAISSCCPWLWEYHIHVHRRASVFGMVSTVKVRLSQCTDPTPWPATCILLTELGGNGGLIPWTMKVQWKEDGGRWLLPSYRGVRDCWGDTYSIPEFASPDAGICGGQGGMQS